MRLARRPSMAAGAAARHSLRVGERCAGLGIVPRDGGSEANPDRMARAVGILAATRARPGAPLGRAGADPRRGLPGPLLRHLPAARARLFAGRRDRRALPPGPGRARRAVPGAGQPEPEQSARLRAPARGPPADRAPPLQVGRPAAGRAQRLARPGRDRSCARVPGREEPILGGLGREGWRPPVGAGCRATDRRRQLLALSHAGRLARRRHDEARLHPRAGGDPRPAPQSHRPPARRLGGADRCRHDRGSAHRPALGRPPRSRARRGLLGPPGGGGRAPGAASRPDRRRGAPQPPRVPAPAAGARERAREPDGAGRPARVARPARGRPRPRDQEPARRHPGRARSAARRDPRRRDPAALRRDAQGAAAGERHPAPAARVRAAGAAAPGAHRSRQVAGRYRRS